MTTGLGLLPLSEHIPKRDAEPAALLRRAAQIRLRFSLLLVGERLGAREADTLATLFDGEHRDLHFSPRRELFTMIGPTRGSHLGVGDQSCLSGAEPHKYPKRLDSLHRTGHDCADR